MNNKNKGIGSLIPTELTPAEKKSDELAQWAVRNIDRGDWRSRQKENQMKTVTEATPEEYNLYDAPTIILPPPEKTPEKTIVKPIVKPKEKWRYTSWGEGKDQFKFVDLLPSSEPKNKFGDTKAQKEKMIAKHLARPARKADEEKVLLDYIDSIKEKYGDPDPSHKYTSKLDRLIETETRKKKAGTINKGKNYV